MKLYHYSNKRLDVIKTPYVLGDINNSTSQGKYVKSISLHIDRIPIDFIKENFPKDSPYFRGDMLYEYEVDVNAFEDCIKWEIVESPLDTWIYEHLYNEFLWDNLYIYSKVYRYIKNILRSITSHKGYSKSMLISNTSKYKGSIENYFREWHSSDIFKDQGGRMYAASVPHVIVYPHSGKIDVLHITAINI